MSIEEIGDCFISADSESAQDRCIEMADDELERIGRGTDRFVYALDDDTVVKFPAHEGKGSVNLDEARVYEEADKAETVLADVRNVADDGSWLVMDRHDVPDYNENRDARPSFVYETGVKTMLAQDEFVCSDIRPSNMGPRGEDEWVLIDYPHCRETDDIRQRANWVGIWD